MAHAGGASASPGCSGLVCGGLYGLGEPCVPGKRRRCDPFNGLQRPKFAAAPRGRRRRCERESVLHEHGRSDDADRHAFSFADPDAGGVFARSDAVADRQTGLTNSNGTADVYAVADAGDYREADHLANGEGHGLAGPCEPDTDRLGLSGAHFA